MYDYKKLSRSIIEENYDSSVLIQFDENASRYFRLWEVTPLGGGKSSEEVKTGTGLEDPSNWDPENVETYIRIMKAVYDFCKQMWKDLKSKDASQLSDKEIEKLSSTLEKELEEKGLSEDDAKKIASKATVNFKKM